MATELSSMLQLLKAELEEYMAAGRQLERIAAEEIDALREQIQRKQDEIDKLRRAIEGYLEKPGCNAPQKHLAMRKLAWAIGREA